ncbi:MAG: cytochrome c family protein [Alphaproteobacteria bacterium]|nr:MAG: cytochrome c family protein [Alphaproteobacteria bacterium]
MNSFELNKIVMVLLLTVLVLFGINGLTAAIFEDEHGPNAFPIEVEVADEVAVAAVVVEQGPSLADMLAMASVDKGQKVFKKCKACHTSDNGGKNLVGPNLWNVVGRTKGSLEGFSYSSAMKAKGGDWSYEDLDAFLKKPGNFVPKTKMSFAGLKKPADRAAVITLLRSFSDAPIALPAVAVPAEASEEVLEEVSGD